MPKNVAYNKEAMISLMKREKMKREKVVIDCCVKEKPIAADVLKVGKKHTSKY